MHLPPHPGRPTMSRAGRGRANGAAVHFPASKSGNDIQLYLILTISKAYSYAKNVILKVLHIKSHANVNAPGREGAKTEYDRLAGMFTFLWKVLEKLYYRLYLNTWTWEYVGVAAFCLLPVLLWIVVILLLLTGHHF